LERPHIAGDQRVRSEAVSNTQICRPSKSQLQEQQVTQAFQLSRRCWQQIIMSQPWFGGRSNASSRLPNHANLGVAEVNFDSVTSLTRAIRGHTIVIASLPVATLVGSQNALIDASVAAGVTRFFPSDFGTDTLNAKNISFQCSPTKYKLWSISRPKLLHIQTSATPPSVPVFFSIGVSSSGSCLQGLRLTHFTS
jgi:hypothetical protein